MTRSHYSKTWQLCLPHVFISSVGKCKSCSEVSEMFLPLAGKSCSSKMFGEGRNGGCFECDHTWGQPSASVAKERRKGEGREACLDHSFLHFHTPSIRMHPPSTAGCSPRLNFCFVKALDSGFWGLESFSGLKWDAAFELLGCVIWFTSGVLGETKSKWFSTLGRSA